MIFHCHIRYPLEGDRIGIWEETYDKTINPFFGHGSKCALEIVRTLNPHCDKLYSQGSGGHLCLFYKNIIHPKDRARPQNGHPIEFRHDLPEQLQKFSPNSPATFVSPVTFPPGRAKLATSPVCTGSVVRPAITIGIVFVAFLAARAMPELSATMMSTCRRTNSAARSA